MGPVLNYHSRVVLRIRGANTVYQLIPKINKKVLGLELWLVLVSKESRVHNLNLKQCVVRVFLYCASYSLCVPHGLFSTGGASDRDHLIHTIIDHIIK